MRAAERVGSGLSGQDGVARFLEQNERVFSGGLQRLVRGGRHDERRVLEFDNFVVRFGDSSRRDPGDRHLFHGGRALVRGRARERSRIGEEGV